MLISSVKIFYEDSEDIFNTLEKLPDQDFEKERKNIINYCLTIDVS
jgi:hypothetical protein